MSRRGGSAPDVAPRGLGRGKRQVRPHSDLRDGAEAILLRAALRHLPRLGWRRTRLLGRACGAWVHDIAGIRRAVARENVQRAFPALDESAVRSTVRSSYQEIGTTFLELLRMSSLAPGEALSRIRDLDRLPLEEARREGRGGVLLTGHLGNWELLGAAAAARGYPIHVVVASLRNAQVDGEVTRARERAGLKILRTDGGLRPILRALARNEFVAFLIDQDAGKDGLFLPFLGRLASVPRGPAVFARLAGAPVVVGFSIREHDGCYRVVAPPLQHLRDDLPPLATEEELMARATAFLEEQVREHPEQWFWMHRRWKTRPPEEGTR